MITGILLRLFFYIAACLPAHPSVRFTPLGIAASQTKTVSTECWWETIRICFVCIFSMRKNLSCALFDCLACCLQFLALGLICSFFFCFEFLYIFKWVLYVLESASDCIVCTICLINDFACMGWAVDVKQSYFYRWNVINMQGVPTMAIEINRFVTEWAWAFRWK